MRSKWCAQIAPMLASAVFLGCGGSKDATEKNPLDFFNEVPVVELSEELIYSPEGDVRARMPRSWIIMDEEQFDNPSLFAVAVDPDYTMSVLFSRIELDADYNSAFSSGGMEGLLREHFERRRETALGNPVIVSQPEQFAIGRRRFGSYAYSIDTGRTRTTVALFFTRQNFYEATMTHLPYSGRGIADPGTMKEIHQVVLGGIEW